MRYPSTDQIDFLSERKIKTDSMTYWAACSLIKKIKEEEEADEKFEKIKKLGIQIGSKIVFKDSEVYYVVGTIRKDGSIDFKSGNFYKAGSHSPSTIRKWIEEDGAMVVND